MRNNAQFRLRSDDQGRTIRCSRSICNLELYSIPASPEQPPFTMNMCNEHLTGDHFYEGWMVVYEGWMVAAIFRLCLSSLKKDISLNKFLRCWCVFFYPVSYKLYIRSKQTKNIPINGRLLHNHCLIKIPQYL